jgi:hypothetical protein
LDPAQALSPGIRKVPRPNNLPQSEIYAVETHPAVSYLT